MKRSINEISGIGPSSAKILIKNGFNTIKGIAGSSVEKLSQVPGFGKIRAAKVIKAAKSLQSSPQTGGTAVNKGLQIHRQAARKKSNKKTDAKQRIEKQRKEKLRKEKLRKEKQRKEKLRKEKLKKEKLAQKKATKKRQQKKKPSKKSQPKKKANQRRKK